MSENIPPDPVLAADPGALGVSGGNLQQMADGVNTLMKQYDNLLAQYPPEKAFGEVGQTSHALWQFVYPAMQGCRQIMQYFHDSLDAAGGKLGAVGGALHDANATATNAAQSSHG